ncbi:MAG TPA: glycosyltransferase [Longimicrobiaceae bacterium]|nr:glycosyltransferase [Longimicrobiaceae bacterium]
MLTVLSFASISLLTVMLAIALWNVFASPRLSRSELALEFPFVSILVPARNEEQNLASLLPALQRLDYPQLEILILDDCSDDATSAIIQRHLGGNAGATRMLRGRPLPEGWLGKCWACHQLAEAARGDLLVFCDADVVPRPDAIVRTVATMERAAADALSALPRHQFVTWLERAVVPLVTQIPVLALLPLALIPRTRAPSISMANGQWLAFTRLAYEAIGGHRAVRGEVVEDVALGRRVKAAGHRLAVAIAIDVLEVRMYSGGAVLREGFAKNLYPLIGGRPSSFLLGVVFFGLTAVYPWVGAALGFPGALFALALLVAVRLAGAVVFGHDLRAVLLHPLGAVLVLGIATQSYIGTRRGELSWKNRPLRSISRRQQSTPHNG